MKKLLTIKQERLSIQEYVTKVLNLVNKTELKDQTSKALIFRGFHSRDQDRIMLTNSMYIENQLNTKRIEFYLKRIIILIRRNEMRRLTREKNRTTTFTNNY